MKKRHIILLIFLAGLLTICIALVLIEFQTKIIRHYIDDILYDNYDHYLSCEKLPTVSEVEAALSAHQDVIQRIEGMNPGQVIVEMEIYEVKCPGKADLIIHYPSHQNQLEIEEILGGKTFFGIPCRWQNW